jgi:two-component system, chemotaxis family, CheB/CheR fusion protein
MSKSAPKKPNKTSGSASAGRKPRAKAPDTATSDAVEAVLAAASRPPPEGPCIVGVGASAGGFEPIRTLLSITPPDSGLAYVVIQHLDPTHKSLATELFSKRTEMVVTTAEEGAKVQANRVYVATPGQEVTIHDGVLHLAAPEKVRGQRMPIDRFFQSLGDDQQQRGIGVVLSGTGADGALGLKSIVGNGGIVLVQRPETAQFDGMPRAALATGMATHVLALEEMPEVLINYARHPYAMRPEQPAPRTEVQESLLRAILEFVRARRGHDFNGYKRATLLRRIHRRMGLLYIESMADYVITLRQEPQEVDALFRDLLIGATEFFRDPDAWQALENEVIAPMVAARAENEAIRIWVAGASTGEEAYTLAMILLERLEKARKRCPVQIFATDTSEDALAAARMGVYPAGIAAQVPAGRLHRFFNKIDDGRHYQVGSELRGRVVFGVQNLFSDPPFSGVDLVSCRNVLIYLEPDVQRRALLLLHFALKPDGILFLGGAETVGPREDLFNPVSKSGRIYRRVGATPREQLEFRPSQAGPQPAGYRIRPSAPQLMQASRLAQQVIFDRLAPAAVLIDRNYDALYFSGPTDRFLLHPRGAPTNNLLALAREGLRSRLRSALGEATASDASVVARDAQVKRGQGYEAVRLTIIPTIGAEAEPLYLVAFEDEPRARGARVGSARQRTLLKHLEDELHVTREDLRATVEGLETSNEELKAANEEVVSINEELQSSNEELQSSKEELQSLNEELNTVNQQLQGKVNELETANNDLKNLLAANEVAMLCLDRDLQIKWFSPAARNVLGLIASDVGRPVSVFGSQLMGEPMIADARAVLDKLAPVQVEVEGEGQCWFLRRTLPYRTDDKRVEGVIITLTDITDSKRASELQVAAGKSAAAALERSVEERSKQLRGLAFELARAEESERQAIARDLHDDLGQVLAVAKLKLTKLRGGDGQSDAQQIIGGLEELIGRAEASIRSLAFQLSPAVLYELGLMPALQWLAEEMKKTYGLSVEVSDDGRDKPLSQAARAIVFRAIRELLINVVKHAGVSTAYVGAARTGEQIEITVTDDGNGFDLDAAVNKPRTGFGLTSVRERLSFIGGSVEISSVPGDGTEATLRAPLQTHGQAAEESAAETRSAGKRS